MLWSAWCPKEMAHGSSTSLERLGMGASSYGSMLVVVVWTSTRWCSTSSVRPPCSPCWWHAWCWWPNITNIHGCWSCPETSFSIFAPGKRMNPFDYCGAKMTRDEDGTWHISHKEYLNKVSPLPIGKDRQPHQPMSEKEHTMLRQLLGSLQWPAVQTSPDICKLQLHFWVVKWALVFPVLWLRWISSCVLPKATPMCTCVFLHLVVWKIYVWHACLMRRWECDMTKLVRERFVILLTNKSAFEGVETPYHVLEWRSFKLPRIARSSLSAEAQSAATAVDSTEFVVRFWHMIFNPQDSLKDTLQVKNPTLSPTFITDAKALYDSYHRDAINHGATDKRTNLELRVVREQVEGMNGVLKWISSERQFGDGLTKISARQLLCDRLRHGAIKFTFDPGYTAAKKKLQNRGKRARMSLQPPPTTPLPLHFHKPLPHVATADVNETDVNEMHVAAEDENTAGPEVTSQRNWCGRCLWLRRRNSCCEEQRLLPADEHVFESKQATEEPFSPVNSHLSKPNDVFVKDIAPAEIQAFEYNQVSEYNMAHDLNAAVVNTKMPVESYARASHVVRFAFLPFWWLHCLRRRKAPICCLWHSSMFAMLQSKHTIATGWTGQLDAKQRRWRCFCFCCWAFWLLEWQFGFWIRPIDASRYSWMKNEHERHASHRTWNSPTMSEMNTKGFWNSTMDENATLQLELDRTNGLFEETRAASQRALRSAKGLLDRALDEMVDFREMHGFHTPGGRCWHVIPDCPTLVNYPNGSWPSCLQCLFQYHVTPLKRNETSGTTLEEDCRAFFQGMGAEWTICTPSCHESRESFLFTFYLFCPVLIALHTLIYQHGHVHFQRSDDRCLPLKVGGCTWTNRELRETKDFVRLGETFRRPSSLRPWFWDWVPNLHLFLIHWTGIVPHGQQIWSWKIPLFVDDLNTNKQLTKKRILSGSFFLYTWQKLLYFKFQA